MLNNEALYCLIRKPLPGSLPALHAACKGKGPLQPSLCGALPTPSFQQKRRFWWQAPHRGNEARPGKLSTALLGKTPCHNTEVVWRGGQRWATELEGQCFPLHPAPLPLPTSCFGQLGKASRTWCRLPPADIHAGPCSASLVSTIAAGLCVWSLFKHHLSRV